MKGRVLWLIPPRFVRSFFIKIGRIEKRTGSERWGELWAFCSSDGGWDLQAIASVPLRALLPFGAELYDGPSRRNKQVHTAHGEAGLTWHLRYIALQGTALVGAR